MFGLPQWVGAVLLGATAVIVVLGGLAKSAECAGICGNSNTRVCTHFRGDFYVQSFIQYGAGSRSCRYGQGRTGLSGEYVRSFPIQPDSTAL